MLRRWEGGHSRTLIVTDIFGIESRMDATALSSSGLQTQHKRCKLGPFDQALPHLPGALAKLPH